MKKINLGQTITIIANLGVIVGIVFLALEISQNNDLLASQSRANLFEMRAAMQRDFFLNDGGIADLIYQERAGGELTEAEVRRLQARRGFILRNFEMMYEEVPDLAPSEVDMWGAYFSTDPGLHDVWNTSKNLRDPAFVQWMEENVVHRYE